MCFWVPWDENIQQSTHHFPHPPNSPGQEREAPDAASSLLVSHPLCPHSQISLAISALTFPSLPFTGHQLMPNPLQSACHTLSPKAHWCQLPRKTPQGPSWWSSSWDSVLPQQGAWVRSPGGELRSLMLLGATKKKKEKKYIFQIQTKSPRGSP